MRISPKFFKKPFNFIFRTNAYGIVPLILGILGGYPIGAKTIAEFYKEEKLSQNDAERLLYWCINPSPAFAISAVGTFMLGNTTSGFILYCSCILASLTLGFFCRYLSNGNIETVNTKKETFQKNIFVSLKT